MFGNSELSYCGDLVRRNDSDRFLISLVMKPPVREALWALFAYNYEIAKTREVVSDTTLGLIRLQWWQDSLAALYDDAPKRAMPAHEILQPLASVIQAHDLPHKDLSALAYAREFDLENLAPSSLDGMEQYARFTNGPLARLAVKVIGGAQEGEAVEPVAAAYALTGLLRAAAFHAAQERSYLPEDIMAAQGVEKTAEAVAGRAQKLLAQAAPQDDYSRACHRMTALYLKQLKNLKYNLYDARLQMRPPFFHMRFLWRR